jgi:hypothetical protein
MENNIKIQMNPTVLLSLLMDKMQDVEVDNHYAQSYRYFIDYFKNIDVIEESHFYISTNFVYGWMPTILNYKSDQISECISLLNRVKSGESLSEIQLTTLKSTINNSIVGVSKLLHFIDPNVYAMWDSRICNFLYGTTCKVDSIDKFMEYTVFMRDVISSSDFDAFYLTYQQKFNDSSSKKMRALENMMFHVAKGK